MSGTLITNRETALADIINHALPNAADVRFLVGYFYYSGFKELYKGLEDKKLKILVGLDIEVDMLKGVSEIANLDNKRISKSADQKAYWDKLVKLFNYTDKLDSKEAEESFRLFCDKIKNGTLEIRKTREPNHAKMYLFEAQEQDNFGNTMPGHMIIGSSNLSGSGLRSQHELNVVFHGEEYNQGKEYFEELWETATPIANVDIWDEFNTQVVDKIWVGKLPSPYLVYLRVLDEYFNTNTPRNFKSPSQITQGNTAPFKEYMDFEYQTDAIKEGLDRLDRHNGVIIADVVGLGKSIIAAAIAANVDLPVVIIAPPHLKKQWEDYCKEFHIMHRTYVESSGKINEVVQRYANNDSQILLIVDEAHNYRNKNADYNNLYQLAQGNKVVLLTATPYNNHPEDIYNLVRLFQLPEKTTLKNINNLGTEFNTLISEYNRAYRSAKNDRNNQDLQEAFSDTIAKVAKRIQNIIAPVVIRRSRKDLEANSRYKKDLEKQEIKFPRVNDPEVLNYEFSGDMEQKYKNTLNKIYPQSFEEDASPDQMEEGTYKAARYQPLKYAKDEAKDEIIQLMSEDEEIEWGFLTGSQTNLANFMRRLLVHRFESSIEAFRSSIKSLKENSENILNWIDVRHTIPVFKRGFLPNIKSLMESTEDEDKTQSLFGGLDAVNARVAELREKGLVELNIDWIKPEFIEDVRRDAELLESIYQDWFGEDDTVISDPKYDSFVTFLREKLRTDPQRKIVLFSEFADTIDYLYERLSREGLPVFGYTSRVASRVNKNTIIENFDAGIPESNQKDDYKILVATDAIAEGYNLHRAGTIFNYDIPYNPTRVIQRIGRINRVNKKVFDELYIYNYFPSLIGERNVGVRRITTIKMRMINAIMGGDTRILEANEELTLSNFNRKFREAESASEQESWETKYREEWENAKSSAEYKAALEIHPRTRIKRTKSNNNPGIIVFGKRGSDCVFKYQSADKKEPESIFPEDAIPLFKASQSEQSVVVSDDFDMKYQTIKKSLFNGVAAQANVVRRRAKNKVRALLNTASDQVEKDYLDMLYRVLELDGLPDLSKVNTAKNYEELKENISSDLLEKILASADKVDHEPENVILSEEMI